MTDQRTDPPRQGDELPTLVAFLDFHRETLAWKCEGLTEDQLRLRSAEPSTLSLLGLVRHLAEVERWWFRRCLAGDVAEPLYFREEAPDADFDELDSCTTDEAFANWTAEIEHSRTVLDSFESLDEVQRLPAGERGPVTVRWVLVHMIEEYARHNGHADLLRQRIDGATGE